MPPQESQILTQTLLPPSSLQTILPLKSFTALFPTSQRNNPQIPTLYRALQLQRGLDLDAVRENIAAEAQRGRAQMRELARSRARDARGMGVEVGGEGMDGAAPAVKGVHDGKSLCEGVEEACVVVAEEVEVLEREVERLEAECQGLVEEIGQVKVEGLLGNGRWLGVRLEEVRRKAEARVKDG